MKFGRYKYFDWAECAKHRERAFLRLSKLPCRPPQMLVALNARLLLEAHHKGPWRSIWAQFTHELREVWWWYGWPKWEWTRTRIFRLPPDADLEEWKRFDAEQDALDEMSAEL